MDHDSAISPYELLLTLGAHSIRLKIARELSVPEEGNADGDSEKITLNTVRNWLEFT